MEQPVSDVSNEKPYISSFDGDRKPYKEPKPSMADSAELQPPASDEKIEASQESDDGAEIRRPTSNEKIEAPLERDDGAEIRPPASNEKIEAPQESHSSAELKLLASAEKNEAPQENQDGANLKSLASDERVKASRESHVVADLKLFASDERVEEPLVSHHIAELKPPASDERVEAPRESHHVAVQNPPASDERVEAPRESHHIAVQKPPASDDRVEAPRESHHIAVQKPPASDHRVEAPRESHFVADQKPPASDGAGLKPPASDEKIEAPREPHDGTELIPPASDEKIKVPQEGPSFQCDISDKELTRKIAEELLSGLATSCVDSTTGGIFKNPRTVAVEIRREMIDYLKTRSENFVAESTLQEDGPEANVSDQPFDIISDQIDDFALLKRNFFSRVSGWLLSDMREDKIDDFVQEMEKGKFWVLERREATAQILLRNVDFKNLFHCYMKFGSQEELEEHQRECDYRPVMCGNEGCNDTFSAKHTERHNSICPFMQLPCEQGCPEYLLRRDMDRHCITVCPMKLASCTFYSVGCEVQVPQCKVKEHCSESCHSHLRNVLHYFHKDATDEDLDQWTEKIEKSEFFDRLRGKDVRSFTKTVKDIELKIGPFVPKKKEETAQDAEAPLPSEQAAVTSPSPPEQDKTATSP